MNNLLTAETNLLTGDTFVREMTESEILEKENKEKEIQALIEQKNQEEKAKEAARQSALDKLAALGLSPDEISAITGA